MSDDLDKLFQSARQAKPDTARVECGFESRLLARLRAERERPAPWFVMSWRLAPVLAAVVIALGAWNLIGDGVDLPAALGGVDESLLFSHLTGD
jgi:hypothetical protein